MKSGRALKPIKAVRIAPIIREIRTVRSLDIVVSLE